MKVIKGAELHNYSIYRIKEDGTKEWVITYHEEVKAKKHIEELKLKQPGEYRIIHVEGGRLR